MALDEGLDIGERTNKASIGRNPGFALSFVEFIYSRGVREFLFLLLDVVGEEGGELGFEGVGDLAATLFVNAVSVEGLGEGRDGVGGCESVAGGGHLGGDAVDEREQVGLLDEDLVKGPMGVGKLVEQVGGYGVERAVVVEVGLDVFVVGGFLVECQD